MTDKKDFKPFTMVVATARGYIAYRDGKTVFVRVDDRSNLPLYFLLKFGTYETFRLVPEGTGTMRSKLIQVLEELEAGSKKRND